MDTIWVTLTADNDPTKPPVFQFYPKVLDIKHGAKTVVHWRKKKPVKGLNFAFVALVFHKNNPFSNTVVKRNEISSLDTNTSKKAHSYHVLVEINGTIYSSEHGGATSGIRSGGTIRNN
jgi:hypothetical protein